MKSNRSAVFAVLVAILWFALPSRASLAEDGSRWFRGQMHTHTYWSDGRGFPEQAVAAFKDRGYDFLAITEHNRFAEDRNVWREVAAEEGGWPPKITNAIFDTFVQAVGKDAVETKTENGVTRARLKTYAELKEKFEEPGRFLLMPGVEATENFKGHAVHMNYINVPAILPCIQGDELIKEMNGVKTVSELIALNASQANQAAAALKRPCLFTLNHPFWVYYDVLAQNLIDCPEVRFFEVCNGGADYASHAQAPNYTVEKFWDAVNAFRRIQNQPLLFGVGSDDSHFYDAERIKDNCGVGDAWVMVHAATLTPESLIAAMQQGDFYASCGVLLDEVAFTPGNNTLRVRVRPEPGVHYTIRFITTKRNFDRRVTEVESPAEKKRPARSIPIYSDDIGRTVKTVEGLEAEYPLAADDLYVRASVESDQPARVKAPFHPNAKMAWTQPYAPAEK